MSTPLSFSGFSGEAAASSGMVATGRRFANRPSALRIASSPCSGRICTGMSAHFGPPTAPSRIPSDALHAAIVASGNGLAGRVVGGAADQRVLELKSEAEALRHGLEHANGSAT